MAVRAAQRLPALTLKLAASSRACSSEDAVTLTTPPVMGA